jgi:hypothetical protein
MEEVTQQSQFYAHDMSVSGIRRAVQLSVTKLTIVLYVLLVLFLCIASQDCPRPGA